jgi:hypothetical protein
MGVIGSASQRIENATNSTKPPIPAHGPEGAHARVKINPFVKFVAVFSKFCISNVSTKSGMTRTLNCTRVKWLQVEDLKPETLIKFPVTDFTDFWAKKFPIDWGGQTGSQPIQSR